MSVALRQEIVDALYRRDVHAVLTWLGSEDAARSPVTRAVVQGIAVREGNVEIAIAVLRSGIHPDDLTREGSSLLALAAERGHLELVDALLAAGADVNRQDVVGCTALHRAAFHQQFEATALLLTRGANPRIVNCEGNTALDLARLQRFSVNFPWLGSGGGVFKRPWDSRVARLLRRSMAD